MQPGKQYVAPDGYQYFMCPFTEFKITQVENEGTHLGSKAVDFASGKVGEKAAYFIPADSVCVNVIPGYGESRWQTSGPVHCANGYFGIVTYEIAHDETFNAYVGMKLKQGQQLGNMGKKPSPPCTGVHCHIQLTQSNLTSMSYNSQGVYTFGGNGSYEAYVDDCFYVDDTNIIDGKAGNWRKCNAGQGGSSGYDDSQLIPEKGRAIFQNDTPIICHRDSPTGPSFGSYKKGEVQDYTEKWIGNGHRYISFLYQGNIRCFVAVSGSEVQGEDPWATFEEYGGNKPTEPEQPTEPEEPAKEFPDSVKYKGIDVSEHNNADIDFTQYDFVILRANWWTTEDKKFKAFADKLDELGIPYGVYCYDYSGDEETALQQAKFTHELIKDRDIKLGVWMDMEDADGWKKENGYLDKEHCTMVCKVFCDYFKAHGYYTGIYSSSSWFGSMIDELGYPKWIANWGTNDGTCQGDFSSQAVMHQYTSTPIDKNVMYVDMSVMKSDPKQPDPEDPEIPENQDRLDVELINEVMNKINNILK